MKITASNPSVEELELSYLASPYQAGVTSIKVRNNEKFTNGKKVMIGVMGNERTEIVTINGAVTPGTDLTITATKFPHEADDPIYVLKYDQIKIYRSITGVDGAYNLLDTVAIDVDNESLSTVYDDVNGLSSYYYKISFYDSVGSIESSLSEAIPATGYPRGTVGKLINEFFEEVADTTQQNMSVTEALSLMNEVNDDLLSQARRPFRWLKKKTTLSTTAGDNTIPLPEDVYKIDRVAYTYADGIEDRTDLYRIISMEEMQYLNYDNTFDDSDYLEFLAIDETNNELILKPTPLTTQSNKITLYYWSKFTEITSMAQKFQTPTPRVYKLFLMARYYRKRSTKEPAFIGISDRYVNDYTGEIVKMQRANRLDVGSPQGYKPDTYHSRGLRRY